MFCAWVEGKDRPMRKPFFCFLHYKTKINPVGCLDWTEEMDLRVKELVDEYQGDWRKVASLMNNDAITERLVVERYKKTINPMLRTGAFTRTEDALLLLTIERLKPFLFAEGHFGAVLAYLPWRYETSWRAVSRGIFHDAIQCLPIPALAGSAHPVGASEGSKACGCGGTISVRRSTARSGAWGKGAPAHAYDGDDEDDLDEESLLTKAAPVPVGTEKGFQSQFAERKNVIFYCDNYYYLSLAP
jgi:hypothetical protein